MVNGCRWERIAPFLFVALAPQGILVARTRWLMASSLLIAVGGVIAFAASFAARRFNKDDESVCDES